MWTEKAWEKQGCSVEPGFGAAKHSTDAYSAAAISTDAARAPPRLARAALKQDLRAMQRDAPKLGVGAGN